MNLQADIASRPGSRAALALAALIMCLLLPGCAELQRLPGTAATSPAATTTTASGAAPVRPAKPAENQASATTEYQIGPEDLLEIVVWKEEGLKKEVLVRPDGGISFPLIGDLKAEGKTPSALQAEITRQLSRYIPRPSVSVSVLKTASYKVYVIGKVNKPGEFTLGRPVDVLQALSLAGGLTPFAASESIRILRKGRDAETSFLFDYREVQRGIDLDQNIQLRSGDTVVVP